jgi:RimJ/RimL family protein N-acetyltransferase
MPGPVFLRGDTVALRTVEEDDLDYLQSLVNHPDIRRSTTFTTPINAAQERDWFENRASSDDTVNLLVCVDEEAVGSIGLHHQPPPGDTSEIGVFLDPDHWGNGYATDAARALTDYAFDELGKHRVVARVYDFNDASKRIWEKLGYRHEATHQEVVYRNGEYADVEYYAVLEREWRDK